MLQWLERRGTDLLNRQMLVRIQPGAPLIEFFHGRVAQRMSADFLHRRMHVRFVPRSPIRRVNWAGAQRRLLSDRPAQPVRIVLSTLRQFRGHGVLGCVLGFQPRGVSSILTARTNSSRTLATQLLPRFAWWKGWRTFTPQLHGFESRSADQFPLRLTAGCRTLNARIVVRIHEGEPIQGKMPV
jgi:hypothetical protein